VLNLDDAPGRVWIMRVHVPVAAKQDMAKLPLTPASGTQGWPEPPRLLIIKNEFRNGWTKIIFELSLLLFLGQEWKKKLLKALQNLHSMSRVIKNLHILEVRRTPPPTQPPT